MSVKSAGSSGSGATAMLWGGLVTFAGIWFYGYTHRRGAAAAVQTTN